MERRQPDQSQFTENIIGSIARMQANPKRIRAIALVEIPLISVLFRMIY